MPLRARVCVHTAIPCPHLSRVAWSSLRPSPLPTPRCLTSPPLLDLNRSSFTRVCATGALFVSCVRAARARPLRRATAPGGECSAPLPPPPPPPLSCTRRHPHPFFFPVVARVRVCFSCSPRVGSRDAQLAIAEVCNNVVFVCLDMCVCLRREAALHHVMQRRTRACASSGVGAHVATQVYLLLLSLAAFLFWLRRVHAHFAVLFGFPPPFYHTFQCTSTTKRNRKFSRRGTRRETA